MWESFIKDIIKGPLISLGKKVLAWWHGYELQRIEDQIQKAQSALEDQNLYDFLKWLYPWENILERQGYIYPVAIFPASESQWNDVESPLLSFKPQMPDDKDLLIKDTRYRRLMHKLGRPLEDRITYTMSKLVVQDSRLGLECTLGSYFRALDSCDALEWELLYNWAKVHPEKCDFEKFLTEKLRLRQKLHGIVDNPVRDGKGRSAAIAILTLLAFIADGKREPTLWLKLRSRRGVAVHGALYHVIPSFMFQPATLYFEEEFSVAHNIYREYLEEIFNRPEPKEGESEPRYFYNDPCLTDLLDLLGRRKAQLFFTGLAVNLLNLRPAICTLLLIKDPNWYKSHSESGPEELRIKLNDEWVKNVRELQEIMKRRKEVKAVKISYSDNDADLIEKGVLRPSQMVPSGAAAFWLGIDVLRKILNNC